MNLRVRQRDYDSFCIKKLKFKITDRYFSKLVLKILNYAIRINDWVSIKIIFDKLDLKMD